MTTLTRDSTQDEQTSLIDANTLYNITDDTDVTLTLLEALYPVGSVYITTANTCPLSTLISGSTWTQETCRQLVEKKTPTNNDPSWYNLYSDGWCEQGGILSGGNWAERTINFLKEYIDTNYIVTRCYTGVTSNNGLTGAEGGLSSKNKASCTLYTQWNSNVMWQACGYTSTTTSHKQFRRTA